MLKKTQKLNTQEYKQVFSHGKRKHNPYLTVIILEMEDCETKIAVSVGKKVYSKAYLRNTYRRKLAYIVSSLYPQIEQGKHIIIQLKKKLDNVSVSQQREIITALLPLKDH